MPKLFYFCDETSFHDPQMAVGGLAIKDTHIDEIREELAALNDEYHVASEVKWENAQKRRKNTHEAYINYLFDLSEGESSSSSRQICAIFPV